MPKFMIQNCHNDRKEYFYDVTSCETMKNVFKYFLVVIVRFYEFLRVDFVGRFLGKKFILEFWLFLIGKGEIFT